jgi:hypothetical protein
MKRNEINFKNIFEISGMLIINKCFDGKLSLLLIEFNHIIIENCVMCFLF